MDIKTLTNPPITEATLEIRFNTNKNITVENLLKLAESLKDKYPKQESITVHNFEFRFSEQDSQQQDSSNQIFGYRLTNTHKNIILIITIDKLAVSTLAPYKPWPELKTNIKNIFTKYLDYAPQTEIIRLGMRYINKVNLPYADDFNFQKYITTFQPLPKYEGLVNSVSKFETNVTIPLEDINCISNIRQVLLEPKRNEKGNPEYLPFILDIDVLQLKLLKVTQNSEIWETFEKMAAKKNAIFFGTFTDEILKQYE